MKITNREILNFANTPFGNKHLPVRISFAISKNAEAVAGALKAYEETRKSRLEKYAKKGEDGKPIVEGGNYVIEDMEKWSEEISELLDTETEVMIQEISIEEFAKCDDPRFDTLSVAEMSILKFMITD